jgi:NADH-quinone oxidoreductase subunit F
MPAPEQHRLIFKNIGSAGYTNDLACYQRSGGYGVLKKAVSRKPEELMDEVKKSGLRGRGGAGFSCGVKWSLVDRKSGKPIYLIVNADESEPGTFKDRYIIYQDPHQLIEGIMISCFANKVERAFIYIRGEFPDGATILEKAIAEARAAGFVGPNILGTGYGCEIYVHRGAGAYICGEETGLIESLEGKRPYPRIKPPYFPAVLGLYMCPTIVNNVETLCHVKHIVDMGGEAYARIGTPGNTGTRILCVSGHVQRPGYYEFEVGKVTMGQLLNEVCGGPLPGRTFKAVIPGGSSAKVLRFGERYKGKRKVGAEMVEYDWGVEDIPMDFDSLAMIGSMGGSGGVIVMDDSVSMVEALGNINEFYSHESCGQCTPCREGSLWMKKITARMVHGEARPEDGALLKSVADQVAGGGPITGGRTICAFGEACAWPTQSFIAKFGDEFKGYAEAKKATRPDGIPDLV